MARARESETTDSGRAASTQFVSAGTIGKIATAGSVPAEYVEDYTYGLRESSANFALKAGRTNWESGETPFEDVEFRSALQSCGDKEGLGEKIENNSLQGASITISVSGTWWNRLGGTEHIYNTNEGSVIIGAVVDMSTTEVEAHRIGSAMLAGQDGSYSLPVSARYTADAPYEDYKLYVIGDTCVDSLINIYSAAEAPTLILQNATDVARDTQIQFVHGGATPTTKFTVGVDDSDSDKWKVSNTGSLSSSTEDLVFGDNILVCDWDNTRIQVLNRTTGAYVAKNEAINGPTGACAYGDYIYVTDIATYRLKKLKVSDLSVVAQACTIGSGDDNLGASVHDICTDGTFVYIADTTNDRIMKRYCSDLSYHSKFGSYGTGDDQFNSPRGICYADGFLYITDTANDRLKKHSAASLAYVAKIGSTGHGDDEFDGPNHCETDGTNVYIADNYASSYNRIKSHRCSDLAYVDEVIDAGGSFFGVDVDEDEVYASSYGGDNIKVYDTATLTLQRTLSQFGFGDGDLDAPKGVCTFRERATIGDLFVIFQDGTFIESYPAHRFYNGIDLMEDSDTRTSYVRLLAPSSLTNTYQLVMPDDLPSAKNHLYCDAAGALGWGQNVDTDGTPSFGSLTLSETLTIETGTAPTASVADGIIVYSEDIVAGQAALHIRNENDDIIKLYKYIDGDLANTPNTGDTDTDDMIQALADLVVALGIGAASIQSLAGESGSEADVGADLTVV